jgi:hypothetical protein
MATEQTTTTATTHPLQTKWTMWFDKKLIVIPQQPQTTSYRDHLKKLATFETLEDFLQHYAFFERPSELPKNSNFHLFRHEIVPMVFILLYSNTRTLNNNYQSVGELSTRWVLDGKD